MENTKIKILPTGLWVISRNGNVVVKTKKEILRFGNISLLELVQTVNL